MPNTKY